MRHMEKGGGWGVIMNQGIYLLPDSGPASGNITGNQRQKFAAVAWF